MSGLHVAVIMDGNGRWATARGLPRWRGHLAGIQSVRRAVEAAPDLGVGTLTLYAFSADNWKRPRSEISVLFNLLKQYCDAERDALMAQGVRLTAIGRRDRIPRVALETLEGVEQATAAGTRLHLRLAIDYSARRAITDAVRVVASGESDPRLISQERLNDAILGGASAPDLLIRTSGERRLSDFLLWELAYTELYFTPVLWPEFGAEDLAAAIRDYTRRERRYGGLGSPVEDRLAG